jgi:hypothetical protein
MKDNAASHPPAVGREDPREGQGDRALQAVRETRVHAALAAPELLARLLAIAKNDRHPKQLDAIKLGLAYGVGAPTLRVEAQVEVQPSIPPEVMRQLSEGLADVVDLIKNPPVPRLLSGDEVVPKPGEIEAVMGEVERVGVAPDPAAGQPEPRRSERTAPRSRLELDEELRRRAQPGVPRRG